jgi:putative transposase
MNALVAESQISEALNIVPRAVRLQAVKDSWPVSKKQKQGGNEVHYVRDLLPMQVQKSLVVRQSVTGAGVPTVIHDTPVPKRSNKIGLAKYNLVHAFRIAKEQAPWGGKGQAAIEFLLAYNTGLLLPGVFKEIGQIQERTLEALDKKLRNNNDDYLALCDGRGGWKKHGTNKYQGRKLSETAKAVFLRCYLDPHRPSVTMAILTARAIMKQKEIPEYASNSTFARWLKDYEKFNAGVICLAREGMKAYQDKYGPYISRDASLLKVGQCLVADGKTLNFNILHPETGRPCRMTLIVFFDWASRYPCGWHIMPSEDQYGILTAFRNAVEALGRYPDAVYLDNGRAFKSKLFTKTDPDFSEMTGLYARVGTAVMFAKPYNGRAKVVERFFKTFQDQFEFMVPSHCGDSIQTKPAHMHRNEKFHKAWHEARTQGWIPNIREAAIMIDQYIKWYSKQPHSDLPAPPAEIFIPNRGPGVDLIQLNYDFLIRKEVRPHNCRVTLWKIDYESDCLHNFSKKQKICAAVNTADMRTIWLYTLDGIYLGEAYPVRACHPLARMFGDQVALDQVIAENKRQARLAKANKKQLEYMGITKDTDSFSVLPFAAKKEKTPILPAGKTTKVQASESQKKLSNKEVKRLEHVIKKAEQEKEVLPEIPRPKYWSSGLEHYEWVFRLIHEHGREAEETDKIFMKQFESMPEFKNYQQRFEDLKLVFNLG